MRHHETDEADKPRYGYSRARKQGRDRDEEKAEYLRAQSESICRFVADR